MAENLISVIIPCYNQGKFLHRAIESVSAQSYRNYEIIVIDDGSTDNTRAVSSCYSHVKYYYQSNKGLSAARNLGITKSNGAYLVFLDADDWLEEEALSANSHYLNRDDRLAFVSGQHRKVNESNEIIGTVAAKGEIYPSDPVNYYTLLLQHNYIGMHATVMYRRWVFDQFKFDESLKACEDYDLYLKITRKHEVIQHEKPIATYYIHSSNMSKNIPVMLTMVFTVLHRQEVFLLNDFEKKCYQNGFVIWRNYYCQMIFNKMMLMPITKFYKTGKDMKMLYAQDRELFHEVLRIRGIGIKNKIRKILGRKSQSMMVPALKKVKFGDFNRTTPFSIQFGYDRGGPVDRYYIEKFLEQNKTFIKGRVLEIGDNEYTLKFGGIYVVKSEILHVDEKNPNATYVGDLSNMLIIPDNTFDCIILTQTLHLIYECRDALKTCCRILKPGGVLLLTVPGITHIDYGEWAENWLWAFTQKSITKMLSEFFSKTNIKTNTYGNVLVASAFLYGMGLPELKESQLNEMDPHYQLIITACVVK